MRKPKPSAANRGSSSTAAVTTIATSALGVAAVAIGTFANSLEGELVFDDFKAVTENPDVVTHAPLGVILRHDFWGAPISSFGSHGSWRPLTTLSFRLNHELHGASPFGYHVGNVALHALVSVLFLLVLHRTVLPTDLAAATFGAALFAALPVHCDAVASVVGRAEVLSAAWFFVGLSAYAPAALGARSVATQLVCVLAAAASGLAATLSKEQGFTMFGLCVALEALGATRPPPAPSRRGAAAPATARMLRLCAVCGTAAALLLARLRLLRGQPEFNDVQNPASHHPSFGVRCRTFWYLAARHALLLLQTSGFSCDTTGASIPLLLSPTARERTSDGGPFPALTPARPRPPTPPRTARPRRGAVARAPILLLPPPASLPPPPASRLAPRTHASSSRPPSRFLWPSSGSA